MIQCLIISLAISMAQPPQDLLKQYGTESNACALAINRAMKATESEELETALQQIRIAMTADPKCEMAQYWHAIILGDSGRVEDAIAAYEKMVDGPLRNQSAQKVSEMVIDGLINLGITHGTRGNLDQSIVRFSQAAQSDITNRHGYHDRSYRNMAISLYNSQAYWPALLCAMKAHCSNPSEASEGMVAEFAKPLNVPESMLDECDIDALLIALADADMLEDTTVDLLRARATNPVLPRPASSPIPELATDTRFENSHRSDAMLLDVIPDEKKNRCYLFWSESDVSSVIDFDTGVQSELPIGRSIQCATMLDGRIYVGAQGVGAIDAITPDGKLLKSYSIPAPATGIALCDKTDQAFVATGSTVYQLNLKTGKYRDTKVPGARISIDSEQGIFYTLHQPRDRNRGTESGHILINGRPIFYNLHTSSDIRSYQAVVFRVAFDKDGNTTLAGVRTQAASNAFTMKMSDDSKWISVSGGGGYRGPGGGGYGTAVFSSDDLGFLGGFYKTDAYPKGSAFSRDGKYFAAVSSSDLCLYKFGSPTGPSKVAGNFGRAVAWSPDGQYIIVGGEKKGMHVFSLTK